MKKLALPILFLLIVVMTNQLQAQMLKTKLQVTVRNGLGNIVEGATVTLYKTQSDYENNENPVQSGQTDKKGRIIFKKLNPISYYMDVRKGDLNNDGRGVQTTKLMAKKKNMLATIIE